MTTEYSGKGDPQRSMELLWGVQRSPTRGPKPGLSVERIVRAAVEVADADGLVALSMRRVAEQLGVGVMSLYTYVPSKAELLDVMLDTVFGEVARPDSAPGGWRAGLELRAREDWALYQRHPWVLQVSGARSLLGPNETSLLDATLHVIAGIGLSGREMMSVVSLITGYVRGTAQGLLEVALAEQRTGISDEEWWALREPLMDKYYDAAQYPTLTSVSLTGAFDPSGDGAPYLYSRAIEDFEFGLQRVLDGIAMLVRRPTTNVD